MLHWLYSTYCSHGDAKIIIAYLIGTILEERQQVNKISEHECNTFGTKNFYIRDVNTLFARNKVGHVHII
jgi:hypothetical protein